MKIASLMGKTHAISTLISSPPVNLTLLLDILKTENPTASNRIASIKKIENLRSNFQELSNRDVQNNTIKAEKSNNI